MYICVCLFVFIQLKVFFLSSQHIVISDEVLLSGKHYRQLFLTELANNSRQEQQLEEISKKLDVITTKLDSSKITPSGQASPTDLSSQKWDEWMKFCSFVHDFDFYKNQYILITDALTEEDMKTFSVLSAIPWKMVLDLDHKSEERGFYREFTSKEDHRNLVNMLTPAELGTYSYTSLPRQIDGNKMQWLFIKGRESDTDSRPQTFPDWEESSVKEISRLFACCSDPDKFDRLKPVVCLLLPFSEESQPYLEVTLNRLKENFNKFDMSFVTVHHKLCHLIPPTFRPEVCNLSPELLSLGLSAMFDLPTSQEYPMPTSQAGIPVKLTNKQYLYLKEYLEVLYDGCEDIPQDLDDSSMSEIINEHRKSFMSGNWISFISLHFNHDAKRQLGNDVQIHIQRLLDRGLKNSVIVEIRHSPGTGGSTIARRVLWDLHKSFPCAFARVDACHNYDDTWISNVVSRITALEEICYTPPVIVIDGRPWKTESLTYRVVRELNNKGKRALLLRCQHGSKVNRKEGQLEAYHVHKVFSVNARLEESRPDLMEFQSKYKEYIEKSLPRNVKSTPCRVFHFPLMAMIESFHPKLKEIVHSTFDEMAWLEQEVAVVVAFIQKYANQATPALLLYEAFKQHIRKPNETKRGITYEDIKCCFSDHLLNLMVPVNPSKKPYITSGLRDPPPESYTLQHPVVAEMVLQKLDQDQGRDLFGVTRQFLLFPIFQHEGFLSIFKDLFIHNIYGEKKMEFTVLFTELQDSNPELAAEIFCEAAERINDANVFAHAARFHAKKSPPSFPRAKELIKKALSKGQFKEVLDTKGVILHRELKHKIMLGEVESVDRLETLADETQRSFRDAQNFPPTYPNPLIGQVRVWLTCIDWIMKNMCSGDSDKTWKFITIQAPPFFRTCISDSFHLLDIVDGIIHSVSNLQDPVKTQTLANNARLSLMKTFNKGFRRGNGRRDADNIIQACKDLCSAKNFPGSSKRELKRIEAQYILSCQDQVEAMKPSYLEYLLKLLDDLVLTEGEHRMAYHLMKVCVLVTGSPRYTLERGLTVADLWLRNDDHNCLPHFYQMAICFLRILDGNTLEYRARYSRARENCREKSKNHCRSTMSTHFVSKEGSGMSRLVTHSTLFEGVTDYSPETSEKVRKFWAVGSRKKLLECKGRIRSRSGTRGREQPYIELTQGNVELHVAKNANVDIGKAEIDYTTGSLVYFVVSFNLHGPVANGITFTPSQPEHVQE